MIMRRRTLFGAVAALPLAVPALAATATVRRDVTVAAPELFRFRVNRRGDWLIVRLTASNGLTGLGDASHGGDDAETARQLRRLAGLVRGCSIFDVSRIRELMTTHTPAPSAGAIVAASAIEHCLWDLIGQTLGVPSYDLFGGRRHDSVRLYANINRSADPRTPEGFAAMARRAVDAGFDAIKLAPFDAIPAGMTDPIARERLTQAGVDCARAVRAAIGSRRSLLIDAHGRFALPDALQLAHRLEPLDLFWLEEATPADPPANLAAVNRAAAMPTAGGESLRGVAEFYPYIAAGAVDTVMPDVKVCGGLLELKKIAAIAEGAGLAVSPHGPASPVGNVAAAQVACTLPNFSILEFAFGETDWRADMLKGGEDVRAGRLHLTDRPGFGIALDPVFLRQAGEPL